MPIRMIDVASSKQVIKRSWLAEDPVCADLPNIKMAQGTNFRLDAHHAARLARLWFKTGRDFDRVDLLLSLSAYAETFGTPVSKLAGSPVSKTAILTGRAVSSIYAKVMNFRSFDPRADGKGQENSGQPTENVWNEFWTGSEIDVARLDSEVAGLLLPGSTTESDAGLAAEVQQSGEDYSPEGSKRFVTHLRIERNRKVVDDAKAKWFVADPTMPCCVCGMSFLETYGKIGERFIEAHHKEPIASVEQPKVPSVDDLVPVCANCHRMLHRKDAPVLEVLRTRLQDAH